MTGCLGELLGDLIVDGITALIRHKKEQKEIAGSTAPSWKCPDCGTENAASKGICENCGAKKPWEKNWEKT